MALAAEAAIRAWINARTGDLTGAGHPLEMGAFLRKQRSPDSGAYAVIWRQSEGVTRVVAEDDAVSTARMQCLVFAGTEEAAESAGAALRSAFETLGGPPEACGTTGVLLCAASNLLGPFFVENPSTEQYCFQVNGDFLLTGSGG